MKQTDPVCLGCGGSSPSWAQACSDVCADKVHAGWERLMEPERVLTASHSQEQKNRHLTDQPVTNSSTLDTKV